MRSRVKKFHDGTKVYFIPRESQTIYHRVELSDRSKELIEDILHRDKGPAVVYPNGFGLHFRNNVAYIAGGDQRVCPEGEEKPLSITPEGFVKWRGVVKGKQIR